MRGTVLKLKSRNHYSIENDDSDGNENRNDPDSPLQCATSPVKSHMQELNDDLEILPSSNFLDERKKAWMSSLDLNCIPSTLNSSPWKANLLMNDATSSCHQPVFSWNGPAMWKAMAEHPLFPHYMELQAKLLETFETIQSDCKKDACEKALTALFIDKSSSAKAASHSSIHLKKNQIFDPERAQHVAPVPGFEDGTQQIRASRRSVRSLRIKQSPPLLPFFHNRVSRWKCSKCSRFFAGIKWFQKHQAVCNGTHMQPRSSCSSCFRVFNRRKWLEKHEAVCSASKNSECLPVMLNISSPKRNHEKCPSSPMKREEENLHHFIVPKKDCAQNNHVSKILNISSELKTVPVELSEDYSVEQDLGYRTNSDEKYVLNHSKANPDKIKKSSKRKKLLCKGCLKVFKSRRSFSHHEPCFDGKNTSHDERHRCHQCSLCFGSNNKLLKHQVFCCPDSENKMMKYLKCSECCKVFPDRKKQLKHRAICCPDSETKSKVCSVCSKVILDKERMLAHKVQCVESL